MSRAVFLSYSSQDADVARKICDTLRAAGVEVWFDQAELVGGDAWDRKIRQQIQSCALFIPIISAATQARTEGYFRLEWRLAEQRTHLMAKGRPFLLPVVIDATTDTDAHVPDAFLEVQWSRLPGGECDAGFTARVQLLLSGDTLMQSRSAVSPAVTAVPASPVDALVAKARALLDDDPLMTRSNVELAEILSLEAIAKEPANAEAHAVAAWTNYRFVEGNYEDTPKRRSDLRHHAERARLLAPESVNAELAMCGMLLATNNRTEAFSRLQALADRAPGNLAVLRAVAGAPLWGNGANLGADYTSDGVGLERLRTFSSLGRAIADSFLANQHWARAEYVEADRLLDGVFASGEPVRHSYVLRLILLMFGWGDLRRAREFIATLPSKLLLEDVFIHHVSTVLLFSGEYDKALETLGRTQRAMLQEARISIPTALLRGEVMAAAGRPNAAAIHWREALAVVDNLLAGNPGSANLHGDKARLLNRLGDGAGAAAEFSLATEIAHPVDGTVEWANGFYYFARIRDLENALPRLDRLIARDNGRWPNAYNMMRYAPEFAELRTDSRVQAILARSAQWLAEMKAAGAAAATACLPDAGVGGA